MSQRSIFCVTADPGIPTLKRETEDEVTLRDDDLERGGGGDVALM